jgi:aldose 1-epimerase
MELHAGDARAVILPEAGGAFARLDHREHALLVPLPEGAGPNSGFHGSFLMAPWTNRLDGGRIVVAGVTHRMPVNRPAEKTAIHGFLREMAWDVLEAGTSHLVMRCAFDRPPFTGTAHVDVRLAPDHLALSVTLANGGTVPTPMGFGWHPYFVRPPGTCFTANTRMVFGRDSRNLPIAPRPCPGLRGAEAVLDRLDSHFAGWDGTARIDWPDGRGLTLRASGAWAGNLQVFAPPDAGVLAVEPVSHAPDAANREEVAAHGPMHLLHPGQTLKASLSVHWCDAPPAPGAKGAVLATERR